MLQPTARTSLLFVASLSLALGCTPAPAAAQQVTGHLLEDPAGTALAGGYVVLLRDSSVVASTVSGADGRFLLTAPAPGRYTVRADFVGYAPATAPVNARLGATADVELHATLRPIELEGLVASVDKGCSVPRDVAVKVAGLWDEVGKAFQVVALVQDEDLYETRLEHWRRRLDPDGLQVQREEERERRSAFQSASPFKSLAPAALARDGYVQEDTAGGYAYYAPDAHVLLSRSFQDTHCFGVTLDLPSDGDEGWVGIRFRPRDPAHADIEGTLWIDGDDLQPRRLDFRYTDLPWELDTDVVGGRVTFERVADGPWIVRSWRIRMPVVRRVSFRSSLTALSERRYEVAAVEEEGGRVVAMRASGDLALAAAQGTTVRGVVRRPGGAPAPGTRVTLRGTSRRATAGPDGSWRLEGVPEGTYLLQYASPAMDSLDLPPATLRIEATRERVLRVDPVLPPLRLLLPERCGDASAARAGDVMWGRAGVPLGARAADVAVDLSWRTPVAPGAEALSASADTARVPVGPGGLWIACGVPNDAVASLRTVRVAEADAPAGEPVRVSARDGLRVPDLPAPPETGEMGVVNLAPLLVSVQAEVRKTLMAVGVRPEEIGRRFIGYEKIRAALPGATNAAELLERQHLPNVGWMRAEDGRLCVYSGRSQSIAFDGLPKIICAKVVIDGIPSDGRSLANLNPDNVAAMAFLRSSEAGARFGTDSRGASEGGVLFIWTLQGARHPD